MHRRYFPILLALVLHGVPSLAASGVRAVGDQLDGHLFSLGVPSSLQEEQRERTESRFFASFMGEPLGAVVVVGASRWSQQSFPDLESDGLQLLPTLVVRYPDTEFGEATEGTLNGFSMRRMVLGGRISGVPIEGEIVWVDGDSLLFFFMWAVPKGAAPGVKQAILEGLAQLQVNAEGGMHLRAPEELKKQCQRGVRRACTSLGYSLLRVPGDVKGAETYLNRGCRAGDGFGCRLLGDLYSVGAKVAKDDVKAARMHELGCKRGDATSCNELAIDFEDGRGVTQDLRRALRLYEQACKARQPYACNNLANKLRRGEGVTQAPARALALYQRACDAGLAEPCLLAGYMLLNREGSVSGDELARQYSERACDLGVGLGCNNHGIALLRGVGGEKDLSRAVVLFQRACTAGEPLGCRNLADAYRVGEGVPADLSKAAELYQQACEMDDGQACIQLSELYAAGTGVTKDVARSAELREKACLAGLKEACTTQGAPPSGR